MQKAALYGVAVVCVWMMFALGGPEAQKIAPGGAGGNNSGPVPVSVANFPATQTVSGVVEVGRTVDVTGSVAVTNFPSQQQVVGTVNVGNLPLDADGNIRISSQTPSAPPNFRLLKIADGVYVAPGTEIPLGTFDVAGWKRAAVFVRTTPSQDFPDIRVGVFADQVLEGSVFTGFAVYTTYGGLTRYAVQDLAAPEIAVRIIGYFYDYYATVEVWLYLTE